MIYNNNISDIMLQIKHAMLDNNLKQSDIALITGWSRQTVSNLLNGRQTNVTLETLQTLINAAGCELEIQITRTPNFSRLTNKSPQSPFKPD